MITELCYDLV